MRRVSLIVLVLGSALLGAGCGDIAFQTRYLPRASQLTWNEEYKQLPWEPPALRTLPKREETEIVPPYPPDILYDIDYGVHDYHFDGDGDAADTGRLPPLTFD